jgi:hypothetical protein
MQKLVKNFNQFVNESLTGDEEGRLRELGLLIDWDVELEIEFDQACQSEPEYIKSKLIEWLPEINSVSSDFQVKEDSVDIDEWTEEDYVSRDDEIPTEDEIDQMRKPELLDLIDELGLDVDTKERLGELIDLVKQAIEDQGFDSMNYDQRNFIRFTIVTTTDNQDEVHNWIETNIVGNGRVFSGIEELERVG